jgi:hypothetical protein
MQHFLPEFLIFKFKLLILPLVFFLRSFISLNQRFETGNTTSQANILAIGVNFDSVQFISNLLIFIIQQIIALLNSLHFTHVAI